MRTASPHPRHQPTRPIAAVGWTGLSVVVLSVLSGWLSGTWGGVPVLWPALGASFALVGHLGRPALLGVIIGTVLWSTAFHAHTLIMTVACAVASAVSPWFAWRWVKDKFASTSQPFARQLTMSAFLRSQAAIASPILATTLTAGAWFDGTIQDPSVLPQTFVTYWAQALCGLLLFTPMSWDVMAARSRGGWRRYVQKQVNILRAGGPGIATLLLLMCLSVVSALVGQHMIAMTVMVPCAMLVALESSRAPPATAHWLVALWGAVALGAAESGLARAPESAPHLSLWVFSSVACTAFALQLLLVTAHERRLALKRLERQAETDPLTNLLSLSGLYRRLEEMSDRNDGDSRPISVLGQAAPLRKPALISVHMTNADSLEQLLGARQCDVVERAASGALTADAPQITWARIAKAHFVGVLADYRENLLGLLNQLNSTVQESRTLVDDSVVRPTWAIAAVTLDTEPVPPIEVAMACLRRAEQTALDSRQIVIHPVDRDSGYALKMEAEQAERIRQIIQQRRLVLFAQPIVSNHAHSQLRHKYEILIRLHDEQGKVIPPALFLPIAMRAGLMQLLDDAVIEQTFEWFAAHPKALAKLSHCAINLSGPTVAHPGVASRIARLLAHHRLPPHKFTFEITESQAIANPEQAAEAIRSIRACGCKVAIDDFGTGVATFDYLKRFDVDYIKIDGAFIRSLLDDPVDRVIVESIVKVAHELKVRTIAEFVSSQELHAAVTALGVDESQGYAFGSPRPLNEWFG